MSGGTLRRRALLSGTMLMAAVVGYGRRAYAACVNTGGTTYQCSGAETTTQTISANNAAVSTLAGFSVDNTTAGNAITITGDGALSYTDTYASPLTAPGTALYVKSGGDDAGTSTPGSVTIDTNGALSGAIGIEAINLGTGALTITTNGDVTGTSGDAIYAKNSSSGTDLVVTTGAGTTVSGRNFGIYVRNFGTGALTITANGDVTSTSHYGIVARNYGTKLSVTTGVGSTVSGDDGYGIEAFNFGTGALTITANGDVTAAATSFRSGIYANSLHGSTFLSVTTGAGAAVSGYTGINVRNYGTGALTITANGDVTGTGRYGIYASNHGSSGLSVTTGAGTAVSGGGYGIFARNFGTGALTIAANGDVTGTSSHGIYAFNFASGTDLSVTTGAGTTVSGYSGIVARNFGTGALTVTANGDVTGTTDDGIYAWSSGSPIDITVAATSTVTSTGTGPSDFAIETVGGPATVTVAGTVAGVGITAIQFDQTTAFANRLELQTGAVINGNVLGGPGSDTLALSGTGSSSFNVGQLAVFEAGEKTGTGTWTLTGSNTGITTFSVGGGALVVNGSMSNAAFAVPGGVLAGTGTVGSVVVNDGGTFAPGSGAPGTSIHVAGNAVFQSGATYKVFLNSASTSLATVSGTATLAGTVNATFIAGGYLQKQQYTILTAAGGLGGTTFSNTSSPNFIAALSYDANDVFLNLTAALGAGTALTANQQNIADSINPVFNNGGALPPGFATLFGLTGNALGTALSQLSGEAGATTTQASFDATNQFMNLLLDPFNDGHLGTDGGDGGALGYASTNNNNKAAQAYAAVTPKDRVAVKAPAFAARWNVWASGYGGSSQVSGDAAAGSHDTTSRIYGMAAGADYHLSPDTLVGFALGGAGFNFDLSDGLGQGRADLFQAGAFARHRFGNAYVAGALAYGWQDLKTDRTVTIAGTDKLEAEFHPQTFAARLEGGYRFATPWLGVTPYAALQATSFHLPSYAEHATAGSDQFALSYDSQTTTNVRTELGARFDKSFLVTGGLLTLRTRLAWAHDSNTDRPAVATFQTLPGASFTVNGAEPAADGALVSVGAQMRWRNGFSLAGSFEGEFSGTTQSYAGKGTLRYVW